MPHAGLGIRNYRHLLVHERHLGAQLRVELAREARGAREEPPRFARGPHRDARRGAEDVQAVARCHERQAALHQLLRQAEAAAAVADQREALRRRLHRSRFRFRFRFRLVVPAVEPDAVRGAVALLRLVLVVVRADAVSGPRVGLAAGLRRDAALLEHFILLLAVLGGTVRAGGATSASASGRAAAAA